MQGTMFSRLQALSGWSPEKEERWIEAVQHLKFVVSLYREQIRRGRLFLHEHPAYATSWQEGGWRSYQDDRPSIGDGQKWNRGRGRSSGGRQPGASKG